MDVDGARVKKLIMYSVIYNNVVLRFVYSFLKEEYRSSPPKIFAHVSNPFFFAIG
jgi:hypothetical protein